MASSAAARQGIQFTYTLADSCPAKELPSLRRLVLREIGRQAPSRRTESCCCSRCLTSVAAATIACLSTFTNRHIRSLTQHGIIRLSVNAAFASCAELPLHPPS